MQEFCEHALDLEASKVAVICLVRRLNAARWLQELPLIRIWLLTPRPSMPPGSWIAKGNKPGGGTQDFCWLVFERGYAGEPTIGWLHRDVAHDMEPGLTLATAGELRGIELRPTGYRPVKPTGASLRLLRSAAVGRRVHARLHQ